MALGGCADDRSVFEVLELPETPVPEGTEWPALADFPTVPPAGTYGPGAPDPAQGRAAAESLRADAAAAAAVAETLGDPVLSPGESARLQAAGRANAAAAAARAAGD